MSLLKMTTSLRKMMKNSSAVKNFLHVKFLDYLIQACISGFVKARGL